MKDDAEKLLKTAINKMGLSARAYSRVLKIGRTIAYLVGAEHIEASHIAEAIHYRSLHRKTDSVVREQLFLTYLSSSC